MVSFDICNKIRWDVGILSLEIFSVGIFVLGLQLLLKPYILCSLLGQLGLINLCHLLGYHGLQVPGDVMSMNLLLPEVTGI